MSNAALSMVAPARERRIDASTILTLARKEVRESLRNRWFILYTIAFTVLALGVSSLSLAGTSVDGLAGFGRTTAGLINLVILIVPLMALTAGAGSIAAERERGSLNYLLAQPVSGMEVILGKYLGLASAMMASLALGFGTSAAMIASRSGGGDAMTFARLALLALGLSLGMLSVGFLISVLASRASMATGAAIFLWLTLVFLGDLGLMGGTLAFKLQVSELFQLSLLNPLQVFKMSALSSMHASLDVLGPAGLYATQTYGESLSAIFCAAMAAWIILPLAAAIAIFVRRGGS